MPSKYNWKDLAGTAKKWLDNKVTETTTANRRTRENAEANDDRLEQDLKDQAAGTALLTAFPALRRHMDRMEENRARSEQEAHDRERARRAASVLPGSTIVLRGHVSADIADVAVELTPDDEEHTLVVLMEPVDPVPMGEHRLSAAGFALAGFHGPGTYQLSAEIDSLDPGVHHVVLDDGDDEGCWFYWTDDYGPASATVTDTLIEAEMVCQNASGEEIRATLRVPLG
jgi:hypothetical protein